MPAHCCIIWVESCYMSQWCYRKCSNLASSQKKKNWWGPLGICKALAETSLNHSPTFTSFSHMLNANLNASPSTSCVGSAHCWSVLRWSPWPVLRWWSCPTWSLGQYNPSRLPAMLKSRLKWKHQTTNHTIEMMVYAFLKLFVPIFHWRDFFPYLNQQKKTHRSPSDTPKSVWKFVRSR